MNYKFWILILSINYTCLKAQINITVQFSNDELIEYYSYKNKLDFSFDSIYLEPEGKERYYHPDEIEYIKTDKLYLLSENVWRNNDYSKEIIEPVINGRMSLYHSKDSKGRSCFYFQKGDTTIYAISQSNYMGFTYVLFSDCEKLNINMEKESFENIHYNFNSLYDLVMIYNKCMGMDSEIISNKQPKILFEKYINLGGMIKTVKPNSYPYNNQNIKTSISPYFGASFGYNLFNHFGCFIGVNYTNIRSKISFDAIGTRIILVRGPSFGKYIDVNVNGNIDLKLHFVDLPVVFRIRPFQLKNISPYLEFGPEFNLLVINNSKAYANDDYNMNKIETDYTNDPNFNDIKVSYLLIFGAEFFKFNKKFNINFGFSSSKYNFDPILSYGFSELNSKINFTQYLISMRIFI